MAESIQKKLLRVRPPRVRITYDVHTNGAIEKRELPFIVGLFADLSGERDTQAAVPVPGEYKERKMVDIDRDNFNEVLHQSQPRVSLAKVPDLITGGGALIKNPITFSALDEFEPVAVIKKVDVMRKVFEQRKLLRELQARTEVDDAAGKNLEEICVKLSEAAPSVTDLPAEAATLLAAATAYAPDRAADFTEAFKDRILPLYNATAPDVPPAQGKGSAAVFDLAVATIDDLLSKQLSLVMHDSGFQSLEATWRGLFYLVSRAETGTRLKLRVFNAQLSELRDDMEKAVEFDQSRLFKMIYEAEYGTFGGAPYSLLVGGYEIGPSNQDVSFLRKMAEVAAAAHAPFITAASPKMFGLESYVNLAKPRDLAKIFEGADLVAWQEFRESEDSRYVTLVMPRVLMRLPYGEKSYPVEGIGFEEDVIDGKLPDAGKFLWGNAAYFLAERITNAFSLYSWTAAIRGVEGGGLIEGLPIYTFSTSDDANGIKELFCPTEVSITDRREKELNDLGFIALCHSKGSGKAAFFGGQTSNKPKKYINDDANANAALSSRLPYILAASRFAHYVKVIVRDKVGGFLTRGNVEQFLNTWIAQYVLLDDNASQEVKAGYPLRAAQIVVVEVPGSPGAYKATIFLKPHFQLEELTTSIRLVADLPA